MSHDESMLPDLKSTLLNFGKDQFKKMVGSHSNQIYFHFLKLTQNLAYMFDPQFSTSLSSIILSDEGLSSFHKIPFDLLLTAEEQKAIETNNLDSLP